MPKILVYTISLIEGMMNLHEYQAKELLEEFNLPIPPFAMAASVEEAMERASELNLSQAVCKIQVHAGGRGLAGGVKFAKSREEIREIAKSLLGMKMVNRQTGPLGVVASRILLTAPVDIEKEYYVSALVDREMGRPVLIVSSEGGMDIEEVAVKMPHKIGKVPFPFTGELRSYQLLRLCKCLGWTGEVAKKGKLILQGIAKAFLQLDASLLEINPLVLTKQGDLVLLDAKISIDDNALFRHPKIASMYDASQGSSQEAAAREVDLAYIAMQGEIGCMVNGAGLAMATMDMIQLAGGTPANFLDVGGSATKEKVAAGFKIILSDPTVRAILVNIFGGIMNCATVAEGVVQAAKEQKIRCPLIVRLEGTNVEGGKKILAQSGLAIHTATNLSDAAALAVQKAKG